MSLTPLLPILFLDIDDVLCLNQRFSGYDVIAAIDGRHAAPDAVFSQVFDGRACLMLRQIHDAMSGQLKYVISSTWREAFTVEQMREVFRRTGLEFVAKGLHEVWGTPYGFHRIRRVEDIENWLDDSHRGEPFAIVDDMSSGPSLKSALTRSTHPFHGRVALCKEGVGLMPEHVEFLVQALRRPIGK